MDKTVRNEMETGSCRGYMSYSQASIDNSPHIMVKSKLIWLMGCFGQHRGM